MGLDRCRHGAGPMPAPSGVAFPGGPFPQSHRGDVFWGQFIQLHAGVRSGEKCHGHLQTSTAVLEVDTGSVCTHGMGWGFGWGVIRPTLGRVWETHAGKQPLKTWDTLGLRLEPAVDAAVWVREGQHRRQPTSRPGAAAAERRSVPAPWHAQPARDGYLPHQK